MNENVLIKSKSVDVKKLIICCFIVPVILFTVFALYFAFDINGSRHITSYRPAYLWMPERIDTYDLGFDSYITSAVFFETSVTSLGMCIVFYLGVIALILGIVYFLKYKNMSLTVTEKRIYGVSSFGKRVDFPVSSVNSVVASGKRNIYLLTPSGKTLFGNFENADELFHTISRILVDRQ